MGVFWGIFLAVALCFSGCGPREAAGPAAAPAVGEPVTVYWWEETPLARYEEEGCRWGIGGPEADPAATEESGGFCPAICERRLAPGEEFPGLWVLSCFARDALPLVTLTGDWSEAELAMLGEAAGKYRLPLLISLFPNEAGRSDPEARREEYLRARELIAARADWAAFVWEAETDPAAYPGDEAVDWVSATVLAEGEAPEGSAFRQAYFTYQRQKPLLVRVGVASFVNRGSRYTGEQAGEQLGDLCQALTGFPRVRAVVYQDWNTAAGLPAGVAGYDFRLTQPLAEKLKQVAEQAPQWPKGWNRSAFQGYVAGGTGYVRAESARYELGLANSGTPTELGGHEYRPVTEPFRAEIDEKNIFLFSGTRRADSPS